MKTVTIITFMMVLLIVATVYINFGKLNNKDKMGNIADNKDLIDANGVEHKFSNTGLQTNTSKSSIPLNAVLDGVPSKDRIPALNNPKFVDISNASEYLSDESSGILVKVGDIARYYPYNILAWHEIVNDIISGQALTVTFCPLCGSAIVFDAMRADAVDTFGVSGKLYESNLLMYDSATESLWSQVLGKALVGDRMGEILQIYPSQLMKFGDVKVKYPNTQVLSTDTGHHRDYDVYPYGDYDSNNDIYFSVSFEDVRLPTKEIIYAVNVEDKSVAFRFSELRSVGVAEVSVGGTALTAKYNDAEVEVRDAGGSLIPGYFAMWFAWATHHQDNGILWASAE